MTHEQAEACISAGVRIALEAAENGADIIGVGDMGIGNSTVSSAIVAALTHRPPSDTTGRGTGRNDRELEHKIAVVERALEVNRPDSSDGLDVLTKVGGFEIGVLAGVALGGALARRVVVLDGFISGAAALIAHSLCPSVRDYVVAAHLSAEQGHRIALSHMGLRPLLDLGMRLGEGTGAVLAMGIIEAAAACLTGMPTFAEAGVSNRESGRYRRAAELRSLRLAIGFLTVLPVAPRDVTRMGPARAYFPLVGLALGAMLAAIDFAARQALPSPAVGAILVVALLALTRAIHTEGFMDACDGLFGGYSRSERLEILRDSHVGAFAVAGGISLLLLKWTLLTAASDEGRAGLLIVFPCLSRLGMLLTMHAFTYVREEGIGTAFQEGASRWQVVFGLATGAQREDCSLEPLG